MAGSCAYCAKPGSERCAGCKSINYCSKACQKSDWKVHKHICTTLAKFDKSSRPSDNHYIAFFFPEKSALVQIIWIESFWSIPAQCALLNNGDLDKFVGKDAYNKDMLVEVNERTHKRLADNLVVYHRDGFLVDGSDLNTSIFQVAPTSYWSGPMVAFCQVGPGLDCHNHRDVNASDFRHIVDHFAGYASRIGAGVKTLPKQQQQRSPKSPTTPESPVKAVKINCVGTRKAHGKPKYEAIELSPSDPIFRVHDTSDIAVRIGLPIFTRKCRLDLKSANTNEGHLSGCCNISATYLHRALGTDNIEFGNIGFGFAPMRWQNEVGNVIVVYQDKKPLHPFHMEVLADYCQYGVGPCFDPEDGKEPMSMEEALNLISLTSFSNFYHQAYAEKVRETADLEALKELSLLPDPYQI